MQQQCNNAVVHPLDSGLSAALNFKFMEKMIKIVLISILASSLLPLGAQQKPVLTVLDFKKEGVSDQEMRSIISLLSSAIFRTGKYEVIDVAQRETLLKEIEFSATGCSDEACQIKVGRMLSAEFIVVGSLGKVGTKWILTAKMLETESAKTRSTADGSYKTLDELTDDIAGLVAQLSGTPAKAVVTAKQPSPMNWNPVLGIAGLAAGVAALGAGGYFLWDMFSYYTGTVTPAETAYQAMQSGTLTEFDSVYQAYVSVYDVFVGKLALGAGLAGGGVLLTAAGIAFLLLPAAEADKPPKTAVLIAPASGGARLSFRWSY